MEKDLRTHTDVAGVVKILWAIRLPPRAALANIAAGVRERQMRINVKLRDLKLYCKESIVLNYRFAMMDYIFFGKGRMITVYLLLFFEK